MGVPAEPPSRPQRRTRFTLGFASTWHSSSWFLAAESLEWPSHHGRRASEQLLVGEEGGGAGAGKSDLRRADQAAAHLHGHHHHHLLRPGHRPHHRLHRLHLVQSNPATRLLLPQSRQGEGAWRWWRRTRRSSWTTRSPSPSWSSKRAPYSKDVRGRPRTVPVEKP